MVDEINEQDAKISDLVKRARNRDPEAVGDLYNLYKDRLEDAVRQKLGERLRGRLETLDLIQTVWKDVLGDIDRFDYRGPDSIFHWLLIRLMRKIQDKGRYFAAKKRDIKRENRIRSDRTHSIGVPTPRASDPTPSQLAMRNERLERLKRILNQLSKPQRQALMLRMQDDMEYEEIGRTMGKSTEAVRKLCVRALKRVDQILGEMKRLEKDAD